MSRLPTLLAVSAFLMGLALMASAFFYATLPQPPIQ